MCGRFTLRTPASLIVEQFHLRGDLQLPLRFNVAPSRPIHDRMPVILSPQQYDLWLDLELEDAAPLQPLLQPYPSDDMLARPVSTHVNRPANDDPRCIEAQRELF